MGSLGRVLAYVLRLIEGRWSLLQAGMSGESEKGDGALASGACHVPRLTLPPFWLLDSAGCHQRRGRSGLRASNWPRRRHLPRLQKGLRNQSHLRQRTWMARLTSLLFMSRWWPWKRNVGFRQGGGVPAFAWYPAAQAAGKPRAISG